MELPAVSSDDDTRRQEWAREVWDRAARAQGTIVEVYLRSRGIAIAPPDALRFGWDKHTESGGRLPVMIGAVRHVAGDGVQGVHRTYLAMDGLGKAAVIPNKKMIGATAGGAVRLAQAGETLVVGEGVETCLSVMQATGLPAWAALSAGGIERVVLPPLPLAARVVIAADRDPVGERAAHLAAERLVAEGRHVRIALPPEPHNDFNDLARSEASV